MDYPRCEDVTKRGVRCIANALKGEKVCRNHHPDFKAKRAEAGSIRHHDPKAELRSMRGIARRYEKIVGLLEKGAIDPSVANALCRALSGLTGMLDRLDEEQRRGQGVSRSQDVSAAMPAWMAADDGA